MALWTLEANWSFTLLRDGDLVAYGEIIEDEVEGDVELQHLLVAPAARRAGVGQALVSRLCAFLAASRPYRGVWLRAGRQNGAMQCCARAVGFVDVAEMSGPRFLWLKKSLMILSDRSIKESIAAGRITVTPYDESLVQPASIDIRLDGRFLVFRNYKYSCIDPKAPAAGPDGTGLRGGRRAVHRPPRRIHPGQYR